MSLDSIDNLQHWTQGVEVDPGAIEQLRKTAALPILAGPIAVMPDVHLGIGATVGSVIPTRSAIIPSAVGVDIGCGMCAVRTSLRAGDLPDSLAPIRSRIEAVIPVGPNSHAEPVSTRHDGAHGQALDRTTQHLAQRREQLAILSRLGRHDESKPLKQLGTLGGGNHFVELCLDESDAVWVMLHSGSRHIGQMIGQTAIAMAKEVALRADRRLADRDLAWLDEGSAEFDAYVEAMVWAQEYAAHNRALMLHAVLGALQAAFGRPVGTHEHAVNCHHNFSRAEVHFGERMWVTRKGAVSAAAGELGIIPGSMGAKSFIVEGRGHAPAYCSCSHGAGRRLSRTEAKRRFSLTDLIAQTDGVECRKDSGVIDEIPAAYKDIDAVMAAQTELVTVKHTLKQVMCIKG
jgi:tRNA-splicing ligase RtcB (3'-phosphate/5'-hydroxy nucleic acid ligase)